MTIYDNVKVRADKLNLAISEVEKRAEVANGTIGGWKTSKPYVETLQKVASVLNCRIEDLLKEVS